MTCKVDEGVVTGEIEVLFQVGWFNVDRGIKQTIIQTTL